MKVSIVGCGFIAGIHIPHILKTDGVRLVGFCDQNEIRAQELAGRHDLPYYTDLSQMLKCTQPDAVHILTPPQTHAALTIQALEAGCHVLVEKPLCLSPGEADAIFAAARSTGQLVSVDHNHLWSPMVQRARQMVEAGRLGRVLHVQYVMGDDYLEAVKRGYGRWAMELRGGVFCDLIPHPIYLIGVFLPGSQIVSARAFGTGIRDLRELWVDFATNGTGSSLWMSLSQRPLEHNMRIYCTRGIVHIDLRNFCLAVVPERGLPGPVARVVKTVSESWQRGMGTLGSAVGLVLGRFDPNAGTAGAIRAFYHAISKGKPSPVRPEEARAVVDLSAAIWDMLEGKPGAISQAVGDKGRVIAHKTSADFAKSAADEPPRVLVTGGTGFIGSHLVRRLVSEGQRVRVLCRPTCRLDALPTEGVELAVGDVSDLDSVHRGMEGIEVLYHVAAAMSGDWVAHYQGTVVGTQNVLQAATEAGVGKAIYVSSLGVLHASRFPNGGVVDESFILEQRPEERGSYSRAKLEAEEVAREFGGNGRLPLCIIRPGLVYGPGGEDFLSDAGFHVTNGLVLVVGLGGRRLGLTYVENLVDALLLAEKRMTSTGKVYHIVDPDPPTVRCYIETYRRATGKRMIALYLPTFLWSMGLGVLDGVLPLLKGLPSHFGYQLRSICKGPRYDTKVAREELGWEARVSFDEGIRRTFAPQEEGR